MAGKRITKHPQPATGKMPRNLQPLFPVVALGASAGGLEAVTKMLAVLPADTGCAFVLVQHLDPSHKSMMVDLLARHTDMQVLQAEDGMALEPNCLYVIPPGTLLSVQDRSLRLSKPERSQGVRLPFDFFLNSLASEFGARAVCVILSGTGADGSVGLRAIREAGGLVIAQHPLEAAYDGMPLSAIDTGAVQMILPLADVPQALMTYARKAPVDDDPPPATTGALEDDALTTIAVLLRENTAQDFSRYKKGTMARRIWRRMSILAIASVGDYIRILRKDPAECAALASYLLIHVTQFFRNPEAFQALARNVIPELVQQRSPDEPIRVWVPACSTGEEAYSIAILLFEEFSAAKRRPNIRIFASDVSPDAITFCRNGLYSDAIEADVSPERLAQFFTREGSGYRVSEALRDVITFAVQDVLIDPPFSRIDLVSCRNMLIYLQSDEQERVFHLFHFALRDGGYLWLGAAERISTLIGQFDPVADTPQVYRRISSQTRQNRSSAPLRNYFSRPPLPRTVRNNQNQSPTLVDVVQRNLLDAHVPATVAVDARNTCLYFFGPTGRYLRIAEGVPSQNIVTMLRHGLSAKYQAVVRQAKRDHDVASIGGAIISRGSAKVSVAITARPMVFDEEDILLVSFVDEPMHPPAQVAPAPASGRRVEELEQELESLRKELAGTIQDLESSNQELMTFNEEAVSLNEEFMSTNEELETTREELQSLNEELVTANAQLQESLEQRVKTADDLQNILVSSEIATLFLDSRLHVRVFTPAAAPLFRLIESDIGRPLADLSVGFVGVDLIDDARRVLVDRISVKRNIVSSQGVWYLCSISPFRTEDGTVDGVVINLADISELKAGEERAERANLGKTRFLAAASHNLRQPLQTLSLLHGALKRQTKDDVARSLLARAETALDVMSSMLDTLLNLNQLEAGIITPNPTDFPVNDILNALRTEFTDQMAARGLRWRVVPCSLTIRSDRILLTDMVRSLISNALRYTETGSVVLGCRRRGRKVLIELWDTGIGIADEKLPHIFDDYFRATDKHAGGSLGLGLSIAHQIGTLLENPVRVRSQLGRGSVFSVEVPTARAVRARAKDKAEATSGDLADHPLSVLLIEDDTTIRESVESLLHGEGCTVISARSGESALDLAASSTAPPDLVISDFILPGALNGVKTGKALRLLLGTQVPVIILTGDVRLAVSREIADSGFLRRTKPVKAETLLSDIRRLTGKLGKTEPVGATKPDTDTGANPVTDRSSELVYVVDDDERALDAMRVLLEQAGYAVETFTDAATFLATYAPGSNHCLITDVRMPDMTGFELLAQIEMNGDGLPAIVVTGQGDIAMAVQAIRAGAIDFIEKPTSPEALLAAVQRALMQGADPAERSAWQAAAASRFAGLTRRERQVTELVVAGHSNKEIAATLGISQRTVETHRAVAMKKTGARSLSDLVRVAIAARRGHPLTSDEME